MMRSCDSIGPFGKTTLRGLFDGTAHSGRRRRKSIVKVVRGYLEQAGYQVLTAADGETRCTCCAANAPTW